MGKVTILQSLGGGYYKIKVHFDNARVAARLSLIENTLPKLEGELTEIAGRKAEQQILIDQALQALNQYVYSTPAQVYVQDPGALNSLSASAYAERGKMEVITREERLVALRIRELEQEKKKLTTQCPDDFETHAWCVAHNEDLSGQTASIECDYNLERDIHTNQIRNESGIWLPAEITPPDSALQHSLATSAWAAWFNLCVMPAAQRHKARYRIAVINGLDKEANTCNLTFQGRYDVSKDSSRLLDDAPIHPQFSEAQQMSVSDVPIEYMTCDAATFEVGDKVIVDCHTGVGTPTVIGYYEKPRQCCQYPDLFVIDRPLNTTYPPHYLQFYIEGSLGMSPSDFVANITASINNIPARIEITLLGIVAISIADDGIYRGLQYSDSKWRYIWWSSLGLNNTPDTATIVMWSKCRGENEKVMDITITLNTYQDIDIVSRVKNKAFRPESLNGTYVTIT